MDIDKSKFEIKKITKIVFRYKDTNEIYAVIEPADIRPVSSYDINIEDNIEREEV